ncbi:TfoX/Sxy family protein [Candidatus Cloacimonadaceae bacterium]
MATKKETMDYLLGQLQELEKVRYLKMFGEYGIYFQEKMIALVCDDQLYIKPTKAGKEYLGEVEEAPPYPGAKNWFLVPEEDWEDAVWLGGLIRATTPEVPLPKKRK